MTLASVSGPVPKAGEGYGTTNGKPGFFSLRSTRGSHLRCAQSIQCAETEIKKTL
jgi:hypothetical protein